MYQSLNGDANGQRHVWMHAAALGQNPKEDSFSIPFFPRLKFHYSAADAPSPHLFQLSLQVFPCRSNYTCKSVPVSLYLQAHGSAQSASWYPRPVRRA
jgi:hypothetical protein